MCQKLADELKDDKRGKELVETDLAEYENTRTAARCLMFRSALQVVVRMLHDVFVHVLQVLVYMLHHTHMTTQQGRHDGAEAA